MGSNRATYQRQSWIPDTPADKQAVSIPTARADNCLVPTLIEDTSSISTHVKFPLCLYGTQKTILPGMYVKQFDQIHMMSIEA